MITVIVAIAVQQRQSQPVHQRIPDGSRARVKYCSRQIELGLSHNLTLILNGTHSYVLRCGVSVHWVNPGRGVGTPALTYTMSCLGGLLGSSDHSIV